MAFGWDDAIGLGLTLFGGMGGGGSHVSEQQKLYEDYQKKMLRGFGPQLFSLIGRSGNAFPSTFDEGRAESLGKMTDEDAAAITKRAGGGVDGIDVSGAVGDAATTQKQNTHLAMWEQVKNNPMLRVLFLQKLLNPTAMRSQGLQQTGLNQQRAGMNSQTMMTLGNIIGNVDWGH